MNPFVSMSLEIEELRSRVRAEHMAHLTTLRKLRSEIEKILADSCDEGYYLELCGSLERMLDQIKLAISIASDLDTNVKKD